MSFSIRKNTLNDFKYIVFNKNGDVYKAQAMRNGDVHLWVDLSAFKGFCINVQLLKIFECSCNIEDFKTVYNTCIQWLDGK